MMEDFEDNTWVILMAYKSQDKKLYFAYFNPSNGRKFSI